MAALTIYRLAEEILNLLQGSDSPVGSSISINEIKISIGQVANSLLKTEYFSINVPNRELIPNGAVVGLYEGIVVSKDGVGRSKCDLPIKPLTLPRNVGIFSVFFPSKPEDEFIPLEMGQLSMLRSQPMINKLLGQTGYENYGKQLVFNKDLTQTNPDETLSMRLVILDFSQYGDYDLLPLTPEHEWQIKQEVFKMYSQQPIPDKVVDSTTDEQQGVPLRDQKQTP